MVAHEVTRYPSIMGRRRSIGWAGWGAIICTMACAAGDEPDASVELGQISEGLRGEREATHARETHDRSQRHEHPADRCGDDGECDDGNDCTTDRCVRSHHHRHGRCANEPRRSGSACDDGNVCTLGDSCRHGECKAGRRTASGCSSIEKVTFSLLHADCTDLEPERGALELSINGQVVQTVPTRQDCQCNAEPLIIELTDSASLAALNGQCDQFGVAALGAQLVVLGQARVTLERSDGSTEAACVFDGGLTGAAATCGPRDLCASPSFAEAPVSTQDGQAGGIGVACGADNCVGLANPEQTDADGDGYGNACDVCASAADPEQTDSDGDGAGDACDACPLEYDDDGDAICAAVDNCSFTYNPGQEDADADTLGDACDNCPAQTNTDQSDSDGDILGDVCDSCPGEYDGDRDSLCSADDNCDFADNPDQADSDADGFGDACDYCDGPGDFDDDADGLCSAVDNCSFDPNPGQTDTDADGVGDVCDFCDGAGAGDSDGDGLCDGADNCPYNPNPDQAAGDADGDGTQDACDFCDGAGANDSDGDGDCDDADNCAFAFDPAQTDRDADGTGDLCDDDLDGDGVANPSDNCLLAPNADQLDADGDGMGDPCDTCAGADCGARGCALVPAGSVDDFEDGDIDAPSTPPGSWFTANDATPGASQEPDPWTPTPDGAGASAFAACTSGTGFLNWGALLGINFASSLPDVNACLDVSALTGIRFAARGSGITRLNVPTRATTSILNGGTCLQPCDFYPNFPLELTDEWQTFDVPWTALVPGFGEFEPTEMLGLQFQAYDLTFPATTPIDFEICVDDIEVY